MLVILDWHSSYGLQVNQTDTVRCDTLARLFDDSRVIFARSSSTTPSRSDTTPDVISNYIARKLDLQLQEPL